MNRQGDNDTSYAVPSDSVRLLRFTRLVPVVSALVQLIFGPTGLVFTDVWNGLFWIAPLADWPAELARFAFLIMSVLALLVTATTTGVPLVLWLYIVLSARYLSAVAFAWWQQSHELVIMRGAQATMR